MFLQQSFLRGSDMFFSKRPMSLFLFVAVATSSVFGKNETVKEKELQADQRKAELVAKLLTNAAVCAILNKLSNNLTIQTGLGYAGFQANEVQFMANLTGLLYALKDLSGVEGFGDFADSVIPFALSAKVANLDGFQDFVSYIPILGEKLAFPSANITSQNKDAAILSKGMQSFMLYKYVFTPLLKPVINAVSKRIGEARSFVINKITNSDEEVVA